MAKKVVKQLKLQIPAGKATAPPVGPALGQAQVNIMGFCKNSMLVQPRPSRFNIIQL